jgi:hypothetical protein
MVQFAEYLFFFGVVKNIVRFKRLELKKPFALDIERPSSSEKWTD